MGGTVTGAEDVGAGLLGVAAGSPHPKGAKLITMMARAVLMISYRDSSCAMGGFTGDLLITIGHGAVRL